VTKNIQASTAKITIPSANAALHRPRTGYYEDLSAMAAALFGLLERAECDFDHLLPWLRERSVRL